MKKAIKTNKTFILFTLLFIFIAAFSFATFQKTETICSEVKGCCRTTQPNNSGEMIWDVFSHGFIFLVSFR
ncbi:MAG: hypothetical protein M3Y85_01645 [Bacteroidota bacterium]|nr:hypothetical protein [Bacteroidota bacterium]